ncbi:unnamed protein product [Nezara viridula]|uniref:Uncharacterized protein n=1 Tax=Nezara viridula TaxID=85310 RepID=A0A9P0E5T3_NEZVI|nr:unnamed protein product [Nezara viridula]
MNNGLNIAHGGGYVMGGGCSDSDLTLSELEEEESLPYPGFVQISLKYLDQHSRPRTWCLFIITNPYPFYLSISYTDSS